MQVFRIAEVLFKLPGHVSREEKILLGQISVAVHMSKCESKHGRHGRSL